MRRYVLGMTLAITACASNPSKEYSKEGLSPSSDCYGVTEKSKSILIFTKQDLTGLESNSEVKIQGTIQVDGRGYQQITLQISKLVFGKTDSPPPSPSKSDVIHSVTSLSGVIRYAGNREPVQMTCENHFRINAPTKTN